MCCSAICWQDKDCQEGNAPCPNDPILTTTRWDGAAPRSALSQLPKTVMPRLAWFHCLVPQSLHLFSPRTHHSREGHPVGQAVCLSKAMASPSLACR